MGERYGERGIQLQVVSPVPLVPIGQGPQTRVPLLPVVHEAWKSHPPLFAQRSVQKTINIKVQKYKNTNLPLILVHMKPFPSYPRLHVHEKPP